jgi:hypothetical protein
MPWYDRDPEEPETRSLSARAWSTADRRGTLSLNVTNSARMYSTARPGSRLTPFEQMRARLKRLRQDSGRGTDRNVRTGRWAAPWKPAPLPGTVREARERQQEARRATQFRPETSRITDQVARRRGGFQSRGGSARGGFKALQARQNGRRGGRPRTNLVEVRPATLQSDRVPVRNRGWFTSETARLAGSRSTPRKRAAAALNARRPRKRTVR